jgi:hypothetical protein
MAICRFTYQFQISLSSQERTQARSGKLMVINDHKPRRFRLAPG